MGPDVILIALFAIVIGLVSVVIASVIAKINRARAVYIENHKEKSTVVEVGKESHGANNYYAVFAKLGGERVRIAIDKKLYDSLYHQEVGFLAERKGKLLFWEPFESKPDLKSFFDPTKQRGNLLKIRLQAPKFHFSVALSDGITSDLEEARSYVDVMLENKTDHFIAFDSDMAVLEISGNGKDDKFEVRYVLENKEYLLTTDKHEVVKEILDLHFANDSPIGMFPFHESLR
ncbi:MAG: hypothetical protein JXB20_04450 [Bacilli bacterium]|nr:hypothetical protein [Bacilli bacterium]MBN2696292.1 hypothetical protein [Bacilli bacterium]